MELLCVRLVRNNRFFSNPVSRVQCLRTYTQGGHTVRRSLLSSAELCSRNSCLIQSQTKRKTDSVWHFRCSLNRPEVLRAVCFTANTPNRLHLLHVPVLTHCGQQQFHTSGPLRALPAPLIWLVLKPLQKIVAIILGRSIRKWWAALPPNRQQLLRQAAWRRRWQLAAGGAVAMVILSLFCLTHLDECPVTGRMRLLVFSRENYMELAAITSEGYMEEFAEQLVPEQDPRHQVVQRVVQHLAQRNQDIPQVATVPWCVHVVQSPNVNAFVLPNGKVFMFTGMLEAVADVHQLTFILGHEMAHAVIGHSAEQASMSHVIDFLSLILLTAIWAVCPRDSLAVLGQWIQGKLVQFLFSRPYSRKLEAEADQVGLLLAAKACADVRAGPVFWQQMELTDQLTGEPTVPEWLSTHPSHRNRVTQLDRLVPQALELRESCDCPALPTADPRSVFAQSVRLLLDGAKDQGGAEAAALTAAAASPDPQHLTSSPSLGRGPALHATALLAPPAPHATALLAPTAPHATALLAPTAPHATALLAPPAPHATALLAPPAPATGSVLP